MRYLDVVGLPTVVGVPALDSGVARPSIEKERLVAEAGGVDFGNGADIPKAFASFASFSGGSGERGIWESATIGRCRIFP